LRLQFSEFNYRYPNSHLIHDNSGELKWFPYSRYGINDIPTVPYSPNLNAYAERFVRSLRQECLDHFIIFTWTQLRRIVKEYIGYYNDYRPHQGLGGSKGPAAFFRLWHFRDPHRVTYSGMPRSPAHAL
jgi:transposase InsO family protein